VRKQPRTPNWVIWLPDPSRWLNFRIDSTTLSRKQIRCPNSNLKFLSWKPKFRILIWTEMAIITKLSWGSFSLRNLICIGAILGSTSVSAIVVGRIWATNLKLLQRKSLISLNLSLRANRSRMSVVRAILSLTSSYKTCKWGTKQRSWKSKTSLGSNRTSILNSWKKFRDSNPKNTFLRSIFPILSP